MRPALLLSAGFAVAASFVTSARLLATDDVVTLPPFLVEEGQRGIRWRYARSPEFEIISRSSDAATRELAERYHRLHLLLGTILPPSLRVKLDVPSALIVYDEEALSATAKRMAKEIQRESPSIVPSAKSYVFQRDPGIFDADSVAVFTSVPASRLDGGSALGGVELRGASATSPASRRINLSSGYVSFLLTRRTPPLPAWFVSGFSSLYGHLHFDEDRLTADPMVWLSSDATRELQKQRETQVKLLPLPELFAGQPFGEDAATADRFRVWTAQAELFVRWGLHPADQKRREAFWRFVDLISSGASGETALHSCFGLDSAAIEVELRDYVRTATRDATTWQPPLPLKLSKLEVREASASEVARIKGDWERLATSSVRAKTPEITQTYLADTRRTFARSYERGDRDPRLLAAYGLCELEADAIAKAREFLEAAVKAGVIRPRAYLELAKLRWSDVRVNPQGEAGKPSAEQTATVTSLLVEGRTQSPPLPESYELLAEVTLEAGTRPTAAEIAALAEGLVYFPKRTELSYRVASVYAAAGRTEEASKTIERALVHLPPGKSRARFEQLQQSLRLRPGRERSSPLIRTEQTQI